MLLKDFYSVQNSTIHNGEIITGIRINKNHDLYRGHFPDRPVTPGVILMQLFKEEAERQTGSNLKLEKAINVKFMAVVDPNDDENLVMHSVFEKHNGYVNLKGTARHKDGIALKISAVYKMITDKPKEN